jgi:ferredoxin
MPDAPLPLLTRARVYSSAISAWVLNLKLFGLSLRSVCGPAMNCHGCPWSTTACPIGVMAYGSAMHAFPAMAVGLILAVGVICGRLVCSFVCPFGLLQDLLYRLPSPKFSLQPWLRYGKYAALVLLVVALPFWLGFGVNGAFMAVDKPKVDKAGAELKVTLTVSNPSLEPVKGPTVAIVYRDKTSNAELARFPQSFPELTVPPGESLALPAFTVPNRLAEADLVAESSQAEVRQDIPLTYYCSTCPVGTLEASLPAMASADNRSGYLGRKWVRLAILGFFLAAMVFISRPYCRTFCPLGAIYALTSWAALSRVRLKPGACVQCGACSRVCPIDLDVPREVGGPECIACGDCIAACPKHGIKRQFGI